jgi:hypothetical protein
MSIPQILQGRLCCALLIVLLGSCTNPRSVTIASCAPPTQLSLSSITSIRHVLRQSGFRELSSVYTNRHRFVKSPNLFAHGQVGVDVDSSIGWFLVYEDVRSKPSRFTSAVIARLRDELLRDHATRRLNTLHRVSRTSAM